MLELSWQKRGYLEAPHWENLFGELNGWRVTRREFTLRMLSEQKQNIGARHLYDCEGRRGLGDHSVFDHTRFYKAGRIPACVVAMPYHDAHARVVAIAAEFGLKVCEPPTREGWWNAGARCYAFVRPGVMVRWLQEQGGGVS